MRSFLWLCAVSQRLMLLLFSYRRACSNSASICCLLGGVTCYSLNSILICVFLCYSCCGDMNLFTESNVGTCFLFKGKYQVYIICNLVFLDLAYGLGKIRLRVSATVLIIRIRPPINPISCMFCWTKLALFSLLLACGAQACEATNKTTGCDQERTCKCRPVAYWLNSVGQHG